jgi:hypothetical protein
MNMPLVIPPGFFMANVIIEHTGFARAAQVTFGIENAGDSNDPVVLANRIMAALGGPLAPRLDAQARFARVEVRLGQDGGEPLVGVSDVAPIQGTLVIESVTPNVAVLVHKRTSLGGRRNRGRLYLPWFLAEDGVDQVGTITPGSLAAIQTAMNDFLNLLETGGLIGPMVVLHDSTRYVTTRPSPGVVVRTRSETTTPPPTPVVALQVDGRIATQRRRLDR